MPNQNQGRAAGFAASHFTQGKTWLPLLSTTKIQMVSSADLQQSTHMPLDARRAFVTAHAHELQTKTEVCVERIYEDGAVTAAGRQLVCQQAAIRSTVGSFTTSAPTKGLRLLCVEACNERPLYVETISCVSSTPTPGCNLVPFIFFLLLSSA